MKKLSATVPIAQRRIKKTTAINKPPCQGHQLNRKAHLPKPEGYLEEKTARHEGGGPRHDGDRGHNDRGGDRNGERRSSGNNGDRRRKTRSNILNGGCSAEYPPFVCQQDYFQWLYSSMFCLYCSKKLSIFGIIVV